MPAASSGRIRAASACELVVGVRRLAEAEIAERRVGLPVVHAHRGRDVGAVPARVAQVERERQIRRAEQQREQPVVARALDDDPHRPEPVAEPAHALLEGAERPQRPRRHLDREAEAVRHLLRPARELLLGRQAGSPSSSARPTAAAARRSERNSSFGEPGRVEARPPGGIRPARRADQRISHYRPGTALASNPRGRHRPK